MRQPNSNRYPPGRAARPSVIPKNPEIDACKMLVIFPQMFSARWGDDTFSEDEFKQMALADAQRRSTLSIAEIMDWARTNQIDAELDTFFTCLQARYLDAEDKMVATVQIRFADANSFFHFKFRFM
jgi:hypothetical protein